MKYGKYVKSLLAGFLALAVAVTMTPTAAFASSEGVAAEETTGQEVVIGEVSEEMAAANNTNEMKLHWDMTKNEDGTLKDLTGNHLSGTAQGSTSSSQIDGIEVLNLNGGYVDIPDGTISTDATEVTVNMLVKITKNEPASWMWCLGSSNKRYMYFTGCCSSNQGSKMRGGVGCVPDDVLSTGNGWNYESVITGDSALEANEWQNITITYKDGGQYAFYRNGVLEETTDLSTGAAGEFTLQQLMAAGDDRDGYMGWSFYTGNDPTFKGAVADFRIYEEEMDATEVSALQQDIEDVLSGLQENDFSADDVNLTVNDCLGENESSSKVTTNLSFPPQPQSVRTRAKLPLQNGPAATRMLSQMMV